MPHLLLDMLCVMSRALTTFLVSALLAGPATASALGQDDAPADGSPPAPSAPLPAYTPWTVTASPGVVHRGDVMVIKGPQSKANAADGTIGLEIEVFDHGKWVVIDRLAQAYNPAGFRWPYRLYGPRKTTTFHFRVRAVVGDYIDVSNTVSVTVAGAR